MSTCKGCLRYEACKAIYKELADYADCLHYEARKNTYEELTEDSDTGVNAKYCKFFKDRSKFIELPYKVEGDINAKQM